MTADGLLYQGLTSVTITDAGTDAGHQVTLAVGDNVIKVKVTAEDGNATETYTVTVTRAAPTCTLNTGDLWCGVVTVEASTSQGHNHQGQAAAACCIRIHFKRRRPVRHRVQCRIERLHD